MNTSSAQPTYSITLSDTIDLKDTITITSDTSNPYISDTIVLDLGGGAVGASYTSGINTITFTGNGSTTGFTATEIGSTFIWKEPEEFVDCLPNFDRVKQMCEEYPGLKIAYEKFVSTYKLVRDDFDTPPEKRIKP